MIFPSWRKHITWNIEYTTTNIEYVQLQPKRRFVISQIPIFSISKQICWYNWACKLPCKNPYFIAKIRVRVCEIEWTLTTDKLVGLLLREYASIKNWIGDGLISFASGETPAARTPVRKGWRFQWRRCPMKLPISRTDSLPVSERMPGTCGISEISRQDSDLL